MMMVDASSFRSRILDATRLAYALASTRSIARVVIDRCRDARFTRALGDTARVDIRPREVVTRRRDDVDE